MRCVLCGKPLSRPAVQVAGMPVGPVCARRAGLLALAVRGRGQVRVWTGARALVVRSDLDQLDLWEAA